MFRESLLETSAATLAQRSWATLMSFGLEMAGVGVLLLTPMIITQTIPLINTSQIMSVPLAAPVRGPIVENENPPMPGNGEDDGVFREPVGVPEHVSTGPDKICHGYSGYVPDDCPGCVIGGIPNGNGQTGFWDQVLRHGSGTQPTIAPPHKPLPISHLDEGMLLSKAAPVYPPMARNVRVQGEVVLSAIIGKDGRIQNLHLISGHPMLAGAAIDAVRQWRYRPYMLNGQAVEVETTIAVSFSLRQD